MNLFFRGYVLAAIGCLVALGANAQKAGLIPESGQPQLHSLKEEAQDTLYRRWGNYHYARYTQEGLGNALECYTTALKIATKYNHEEVILLSQFDLGKVYDALNDFNKAEEYYGLYYKAQLKRGDPKLIFRSAFNLSTVASKARDTAKALQYGRVMEEQLKAINDPAYKMAGNLLLAGVMSRNGDSKAFLSYYSLLPENATFRDSDLAYGRLYAEAKSNYLFFKGAGLASLKPLYDELAITTDSIPLLALVEERQEALGYYKGALETSRLIDRVTERQTSYSLRLDIEKGLRGAEMTVKDRTNQLLMSEQRHLLQQRRQLYGIALLLSLGFLIATYYFFRIKTQNRHIGDQNEQISQQRDKIEVLLREVHHRVNNNLQIINSVVELQQLKPDVSPSDSLREMQLKMQSIALAHELMYDQHLIEYVALQQYFEKLAIIIKHIYPVSHAHIKCEIDMNSLKLTLDKTIMLALAVNELVINTLKHVYSTVPVCKIELTCHTNDEFYVFSYADNGPGLPENMNPLGRGNIGLRLVHNLIKQLGGTVEINSKKDHLVYTFTFKP